jgi:hypothetical protein
MADKTPIENKADDPRRTELARSGYRLPAAWFRKDAEAAAAASAGGDDDALPEDFPARALLVAGGFDTRAAVTAATDAQLVALDGVGEATVAKIRASQG